MFYWSSCYPVLCVLILHHTVYSGYMSTPILSNTSVSVFSCLVCSNDLTVFCLISSLCTIVQPFFMFCYSIYSILFYMFSFSVHSNVHRCVYSLVICALCSPVLSDLMFYLLSCSMCSLRSVCLCSPILSVVSILLFSLFFCFICSKVLLWSTYIPSSTLYVLMFYPFSCSMSSPVLCVWPFLMFYSSVYYSVFCVFLFCQF